LNETNSTSAIVGGIALVILFAGKFLLKNKPIALIVVAAFAGVLTFGLLRGVLIGAAISLVQLVTVPHSRTLLCLGVFPGYAPLLRLRTTHR
jgi:hypothetical protein